eukprot:scaffold459202_cov16-Prasinocladus_malaysianus.AAC.1
MMMTKTSARVRVLPVLVRVRYRYGLVSCVPARTRMISTRTQSANDEERVLVLVFSPYKNPT